jgi:SAM-dependent methyltransferase
VAEPRPYVLGTDPAERDRLLWQAEQFARAAIWLLDQVQIPRGGRVLDVGCGPVGILDLLAERVGPRGEVIGLEREPALREVARTIAAEQGWANVRVVAGDATATGLPPASFDLAHERLVLVVSPEPERIVAEMVALVLPGGWVALQDVVTSTAFVHPPSAAYRRLGELFDATYRRRGLDPDIGVRLPSLLRQAGLVDVGVQAHVQVAPNGDDHQSRYANLRDEVIRLGLATAEEYDRLIAESRVHRAHPGTVLVNPLLFQAWGQKPSA